MPAPSGVFRRKKASHGSMWPWHNESTVPRRGTGLCTVINCREESAQTGLPRGAMGWKPFCAGITKSARRGVEAVRDAPSQHDLPDARHRSCSPRFVLGMKAVDVRTQTSLTLYTKRMILSTGICRSYQSLFILIIFPRRICPWTGILLIPT